jgi:hypothetical protein
MACSVPNVVLATIKIQFLLLISNCFDLKLISADIYRIIFSMTYQYASVEHILWAVLYI